MKIRLLENGYIFTLGDNRNFSRDSRDIGAIPLEEVIGVKID